MTKGTRGQCVLFHNATDAEPVRPEVAVHLGAAAAEAQVAAADAIHRTGPAVAAAACAADRTIVVVAVTRNNKLQWRVVSTCIIIVAPGEAFSFPFCLRRQPESERTRIVDAGDTLPEIVVLGRSPVIWGTAFQDKQTVTGSIGRCVC
jgi:hypothetical protein